ncbi:DUF742 domain-containing protein [Paractinoplanes atraurantiacus]|uniref:DUF742 domain-containing protein n=1 Tax=Paractinoplanes atraurantiacus TaxID=1036182 RepID=A0A285H6U3_9ACTN|nr:DUF742 domain-containing protein [Actinoplanes atraurantiacus]SNY30546.1 Protein of unknown function [Actinoplanes atraurantiacus]
MPADFNRVAHDWLDNEAGPVVRPYAMTQGRVVPEGGELDLVAFVVATTGGPAGRTASLQPEHHAIVAAAWEPISIVELAAGLDLSIGVVRVLLGDLRSAGLISLYEPPAASQPHDVDVLKAVVNGLRAL